MSKGVPENHIIEVALDDRSNKDLRDPDRMLEYVKGQISDSDTYYITINEQKSGLFVKMHKKELSNHSQKSRLLPAIFCKVKNK